MVHDLSNPLRGITKTITKELRIGMASSDLVATPTPSESLYPLDPFYGRLAYKIILRAHMLFLKHPKSPHAHTHGHRFLDVSHTIAPKGQ